MNLYKNPNNKTIAGVCAGLADASGINVALVRIGFVVLGLFTGIPLIAYLVLAIVMENPPAEPVESFSQQESAPQDSVEQARDAAQRAQEQTE